MICLDCMSRHRKHVLSPEHSPYKTQGGGVCKCGQEISTFNEIMTGEAENHRRTAAAYIAQAEQIEKDLES